MTQEEKQLLLKDLSARLPYWVFVNVTEPGDSSTNYDCLLSTDILKEVSGKTSNLNYKPYLRPMSSMTEEEQKEFVQFHCVKLCPIVLNDSLTVENESKMMDWLIAHHFDFRGLIEKGLALEAPKDMYKEE